RILDAGETPPVDPAATLPERQLHSGGEIGRHANLGSPARPSHNTVGAALADQAIFVVNPGGARQRGPLPGQSTVQCGSLLPLWGEGGWVGRAPNTQGSNESGLGATRTLTPLRAADFEPAVSANSTTRPYWEINYFVAVADGSGSRERCDCARIV